MQVSVVTLLLLILPLLLLLLLVAPQTTSAFQGQGQCHGHRIHSNAGRNWYQNNDDYWLKRCKKATTKYHSWLTAKKEGTNYDTMDKKSSNQETTTRKELRFGPLGSLEVLALLVSLFFVGAVATTGDLLFAKPSTISTIEKVDAEQVLQSDFERMDSSVSF
mgnify:CR=1 FL=1